MAETKYPVFQNKALDYNKLLEDQKKGKLLKKVLKFPLIAMIKYDGHYCVIDIKDNKPTFTTSGGVRYKHKGVTFNIPDGKYIAERIKGKGKLGDRIGVALEGSVGSKYAKADNTYIIHNRVDLIRPYEEILSSLVMYKIPIPEFKYIHNREELDEYLKEVVKRGYEGLMLINPNYVFRNTKSRNIDFCKYKKRPTADLLCIDTTDGEGKYDGMIGSLVLKDSKGRVVNVGSGLSDDDRAVDPNYFIGSVVEIEYEQILDTYIQPTLPEGFLRLDKTKEDID